ncbi:MAG: hypothetical protein ABJB74_03565 [Gemmatimonas sp.]
MIFPQEVPVTVIQTQSGPVVVGTAGGPATAQQNLRAAKAYREVLGDQAERLRSDRARIASAAREESRTATDIAGLDVRLKAMDERLLNMDKQLANADTKVAEASLVPGAVVPEPRLPRDNTPDWDGVFAGGAILSFALLFPFCIAYSRRIWRRSAKVTVTLPPDVAARMQTMEEAIESVAVEVERIGEGQRFMTQALSESPRFVGAGAAEPVMVHAREAMHAERLR